MQLAGHWADRHDEGSVASAERDGSDRPTGERLRTYGGVGTPAVGEFAAAELGALHVTTKNAAVSQMADALDLRHRLPRLWTRVCDADPARAEARARLWAAERFVRSGTARQHGLKLLVARANAGDVAWFMATVNRLAEILMLEGDLDSADVRRSKAIRIVGQPALALSMLQRHAHDHSSAGPPPAEPCSAEPDSHVSLRVDGPVVDPTAARPRVVLYVHLSEESLKASGVARVEGEGPITTEQLRRLFEGTACSVTIKPVVDRDPAPVDAYEIPYRVREAVWLRDAGEMFPWGASASRSMDLDHTRPFREPSCGGPPGQTGPSNLGHLSRCHHRLKTFSRWRMHQPAPGVFLWRSPHGALFLIGSAGTIPLGSSVFAEDMWWSAEAIERAGPTIAA